MQAKIFVVPYFSENDLWNLLDILRDKIYCAKHNHLFFFCEESSGKIRQRLNSLSVIECRVCGDITDLERFVIDYFEGGNHLYTEYDKQSRYLFIVPLTDDKITEDLVSLMFRDINYEVKDKHVFLLHSVGEFCVFKQNPYITCLRILIEDFPEEISQHAKMLQQMSEFYCEDKFFLSHRIHNIPDLRRPDGFKIPLVDLSQG